MENRLIKITDLTSQLGLSSRSLRYYEQIGLIKSVRPEFEKYRFYDSENIERLKQIIVLRKMQIPVKDILRIYESADMSVVVETFVNRIHTIDDEIGALAELKRITGEFLQTMMQNGVTKISALPLLYEEIGKQLELMEERKPVLAAELNAVSKRLSKPLEISIVALPRMRVISSYLKINPQVSDTEGLSRFVQSSGIKPGNHERLEFQTSAGDVVILRVPEEFVNGSKFLDYTFPGGLFAVANAYLDEDLGERFRSLVKDFDNNKYYQIDYAGDGSLRHAAMLENLISPDDQRELVALYVPVKKRTADPALFNKSEEITPNDITIAEIEAQNPILWTVDVPLDSITLINNPHYRVLENGEAEYTGWISTRVLNTNVSVKLPFRVDIEFRIAGLDERFGYGDSEGSVIIYHGDESGQFEGGGYVRGFGVNMGNRANQLVQAISFYQPIFRDYFNFPGRGAVKTGEQNHMTWIVGKQHLAVFINGEIRYCGINFPYMSLDLSREVVYPIVIGSNGQGKKYFKSIRVSQLTETQKNKIKQGELTMITKQSNNIIPVIHRLVTSEHGENYWFNACARYVMECLGEYTPDSDLMTKEIYDCKKAMPDLGYWLFAGLTGDIFTQHYTYGGAAMYSGDAVSCYMMDTDKGGDPRTYVPHIFGKVGYAATYVSAVDIRGNTEMYKNTLMSYIDKGVAVITWGAWPVPTGVIVGYENYGDVLLYIKGDSGDPERVELSKLLESDSLGWIFVGEKRESKDVAKLYMQAVSEIPQHMNVKTDTYCFGAEAFCKWAGDIENGKFDGMKREDFDAWAYYTNYICVLATNGSCAHNFLKRAQGWNPNKTFLDDLNKLYDRIAHIWNNDNGEDLEALGGGFNVTLEVLQDKDKRAKIAARIHECSDVTDEILRVLNAGLITAKDAK